MSDFSSEQSAEQHEQVPAEETAVPASSEPAEGPTFGSSSQTFEQADGAREEPEGEHVTDEQATENHEAVAEAPAPVTTPSATPFAATSSGEPAASTQNPEPAEDVHDDPATPEGGNKPAGNVEVEDGEIHTEPVESAPVPANPEPAVSDRAHDVLSKIEALLAEVKSLIRPPAEGQAQPAAAPVDSHAPSRFATDSTPAPSGYNPDGTVSSPATADQTQLG